MKLKSLIIFYPSFENGGVENIIRILIKYINKKNIELYLINTKTKNLSDLKKIKNLKILYPKKQILHFLPQRISTSLSCIPKLIEIIRGLNNNHTVIHSMQSNFISILITKILSVKIVIRNSEDPIYSIKYSENKFLSYFIFCLRFLFYNFADLIITNSKGSSVSLRLFLLNKNKIKYIYNPYLTDDKIKSSKKNLKKKNIIMSAGRLTIQKNFISLIYAFKQSELYKKGYILNIFGKGYQEKLLKNEIKKNELEKVVFLKGWVKDLQKEYKKSKLFVLPSVYEGLGNVLIEALNFNTHCIATDCKSGPSEILNGGRGGIIVPVNDIKALSYAIVDNIKNYKKYNSRLIYAKKQLKRFYFKTQCHKYLKTLNSVLL